MKPCTFKSFGIVAAAITLAVVSGGCRKQTDLGPVANLSTALEVRELLAGGASGEATGGETASSGTGWATLSGRFRYDGDPPAMPPYAANKDMAACAPGGSAPKQEYLLVDPSTKGIANIAVYLRKSPRVHESAQPATEEIIFDQKVCIFLTHVMPVSVGQPMQLKNSDPVGHNTNIGGQNSFNQTIPAGATVPYSPKKEEATPASVRCSIHPWMLAYMLPRKDRYVAVTATDGTFEIPNLPAGTELELQVWHESAAGTNGSLVLDSPEVKDLKWSNKGRFKIKLEENQTRQLDLLVPASAFSGG
jgi:hypothetical protein